MNYKPYKLLSKKIKISCNHVWISMPCQKLKTRNKDASSITILLAYIAYINVKLYVLIVSMELTINTGLIGLYLSHQEIQDDNKKLLIIIKNEIKRLQIYSNISNDNNTIFTTQLNAVLKNIQLQYLKKQQQLKYKYQQIKNVAKEVYEPLIKINQNLEKQFKDFKDKILEGTTQFSTSQNQNRQEQQITKQVLFINIVELCQVKARLANSKQIQNLNRLFKGPLLSI